jgi:hypothetical protein
MLENQSRGNIDTMQRKMNRNFDHIFPTCLRVNSSFGWLKYIGKSGERTLHLKIYVEVLLIGSKDIFTKGNKSSI